MYAYEQLLQEPEATIPLRTASLFTVAQLYMVKGNFQKGIDYILRWMNEVEHLQEQSSTWPRRGMLDEELWVMPGLLLSCWVSL